MSESFSFLLLTGSAQQREEPACGWILPPPPSLFRVNIKEVVTDSSASVIKLLRDLRGENISL